MPPNNPPPAGLFQFIEEHNHGVIVDDVIYPRSWHVAWQLWRSDWTKDYFTEFIAECDAVGVPYNVKALIRHHRGNAALTAALDMGAQVEYRHKCTFMMDDSEPMPYSAHACDCDAKPEDDEKRFVIDWAKDE